MLANVQYALLSTQNAQSNPSFKPHFEKANVGKHLKSYLTTKVDIALRSRKLFLMEYLRKELASDKDHTVA